MKRNLAKADLIRYKSKRIILKLSTIAKVSIKPQITKRHAYIKERQKNCQNVKTYVGKGISYQCKQNIVIT